MIGIKIENSTGITLQNPSVQDADVGIQSVNSSIKVTNANFNNVKVPFKVLGGETSASGTRISESSKSVFEPDVGGRSTRCSYGWTPPSGPAMPAHCGECQSIFPSARYSIWNARFYGHDNREICPVCGSQNAELATGIFDLMESTVNFIAGPARSRELLVELNRVSTQFTRGEASAQDLLETISSNHQDVVTQLRKLDRSHPLALAIFLSVISAAVTVFGFLADYEAGREQLEDIRLELRKGWQRTYRVENENQGNGDSDTGESTVELPMSGPQ